MSETSRQRGIALARTTSGARQVLRVGSSRAAPIRLRLYTEAKSSLYVLVQVWPTKKAFLAYLNRHHHTIGGDRFSSRTRGTCSGHWVYRYYPKGSGKARRRHPCVAEVNLWRGALGMGVVTHELFHATMRWAHRVGFPLAKLNTIDATQDEERITHVHGDICKAFVVRAEQLRLYDPARWAILNRSQRSVA